MEEVKVTATYAEFKETLDREIIAAENGFVKIGYLLKIARDTNILHWWKKVRRSKEEKGEFQKDTQYATYSRGGHTGLDRFP